MSKTKVVEQRDRVVDLLQDMIYDLHNDPTPENLEGLVTMASEVLTKLQAWAGLTGKLTEKVITEVMSEHLREYHRWDGPPKG